MQQRVHARLELPSSPSFLRWAGERIARDRTCWKLLNKLPDPPALVLCPQGNQNSS
jgi:hypothetical protein